VVLICDNDRLSEVNERVPAAPLGAVGGLFGRQVPDLTLEPALLRRSDAEADAPDHGRNCCRDLAERDFSLAPVALVHAALIFEHVGLGVELENALSLVAPEGALSVVLQFPSEDEQAVASTSYTSMQMLKKDFALIDISEFQRLLGLKESDWLSRKIDHCLAERVSGLVYSSKADDVYSARHHTLSYSTPSCSVVDTRQG